MPCVSIGCGRVMFVHRTEQKTARVGGSANIVTNYKKKTVLIHFLLQTTHTKNERDNTIESHPSGKAINFLSRPIFFHGVMENSFTITLPTH